MKFKPFASSGTPSEEDNGYDAPSMQTLGVDGYVPYPVIPHSQQNAIYRLPLASVYNQNNGGVLRKDFVGDLYSGMNSYMPYWNAPSRGTAVNQTGGMISVPMSSYASGQYIANPITANADQSSLVAQFIAARSPRYAGASMSTYGGE